VRVDDVAGIGPDRFCSPRRGMDADGNIEQYLPGPVLRLLLTGDIPTKTQVDGRGLHSYNYQLTLSRF